MDGVLTDGKIIYDENGKEIKTFHVRDGLIIAYLKKAGMAVCPADTYDYIRERADLVTEAKGGEGVLREVADLVLGAKGLFEKLLKG